MANKNPDTSGLKPAWSSTNQPKNPGRKPSKLKKYIKENGLDATDVSAMAKYILPMTQSEIQKLMSDPKVPIVMKVFAKGVLADLKNSNFRNLLILMDRAVGKPTETINLNSVNQNHNTNLDFKDMTEADAKDAFFKLKE